ncbi:MAG: hypothetical protein IJB57_06350 [Clostridia bacterium]|nr:hypothetical protein [Clostridia bacterium]
MICENVFCIYNKDEGCIVEEIELDIQGKCTSCEYVDVDDEYLKRKKKEALEGYEY